jgi:ferrous iron transport protein B
VAVFSLYVLGIVMAILTGLMLKHTIMRGEASPFIMELPVYHVPHLKSLVLQTWQRLKGFVLRAGKVIVIVSIFLSALNSFSLSGKTVDNINDSALASVSRVFTPILEPIGVHGDHWQATVGLTGAMAKEVVVGTLNTLYRRTHQKAEFNPAEYSLGDELIAALDETWSSLKNTFSLSVLANPIEASKGDGEMATGAMGVMGRNSAAPRRLQLPDFRSALYSVHLRDGRHRPRIEPRLDGVLHPVGAEYRLFACHAVLPDREFSQHPATAWCVFWR